VGLTVAMSLFDKSPLKSRGDILFLSCKLKIANGDIGEAQRDP
jgi:hypothetical protein